MLERNQSWRTHAAAAVVKLGAGAFLSYAIAFEVGGQFGLDAAEAYEQAGRAVEQAITEGRTSVDGYVDQDTGLAIETTPPSAPATPEELAEAAVAAHETAAMVFISIAEQHLETQRWFMGGAGALALLSIGGAWRSAARAVALGGEESGT